ncbi:MAG: restriction endonuclease subunit S [Paludibacteraceae bacterium]|nr:restriction endonuclease subunit S [Paludibacteraceae bacterium]
MGGVEMSEWKKVKLGEICTIKTGKLDSNAAVENGIYPFFTCDPKTLAINTWAYDTEAILLAGNNASGNYTAKYYCGKFNAYQRTYIIESLDENVANVRYLTYAMNQQLQLLKIMSSGSTTKFITMKMLSPLVIPLPPLATQHRIATILSRYDSLIENYQKQIKLLEEAAQRLYKEWFIDLHFPGHEKSNIIDGVPEGWEKKKIGDVCQTVGGGTPSTKVAEYYDNGNIKWVTPTDITRSNCLCLFDTDKRITEEGLAHSSAKMLPSETILMTSRASVGYFGIYDCEVCTNQGFISCIPNEKSYQMYLLYNLMNRVEEIRQKAGGSTYLEISKSVFRNFDVVLPSSVILEAFQEQTHKMLDSMRLLAKQLRLLTEARDRLLPKLMSGEIEV